MDEPDTFLPLEWPPRDFGICMDRIPISKCLTKFKPELPPELKVESRGVMNKPKIFKNRIGPIIRVSIMNVKHDMALFLIGRFEGCRPELFQTSRFTISGSSHGL